MVNSILRKLEGGDRRSIGRAEEVVALVLKNTSLFSQVIEGFFVEDPVVRMRAADVVEKVSGQRPELLAPFKKRILELAEESSQQEVRWHLAQIIPRLKLGSKERTRVVEIFIGYLSDKSKIVKTFSMQALVDLAADDSSLGKRVVPIVARLAKTGSPAVRSRGKKLLKELSLA